MTKRRARTVISPPLPEKAKPEKPTAPPPEVKGWRSRPTRPGLTSQLERPFYGTEAEVRERAEVDEMTGADPVVEQLRGAVYGRPPRDVPTVADLAHDGMARQTETGNGWRITALGQDVLTDAMLGRDE